MLGQLANTTRPAFQVHQLARFAASPQEPHHKAMKRLVAYLMGTIDEGMHVRKTTNNVLECRSDADFVGLYGKEEPQDPTSCRFRAGFIISINNNPVCWKSCLQTQTADSVMCAE